MALSMLRSFQSVLGGGGMEGTRTPSSADTIERLVDRLNSSTLLDDRRDACRALKAMSRKFRIEVGAQALDALTAVLKRDRSDEEIVGYALDALANICCPEAFEEEENVEQQEPEDVGVPIRSASGIGERFTEIFLKRLDNVQMVLDILEEFDFRVRRPAVKLLTYLLVNEPRNVQEAILASRMGVSRLMDILVDSREVLRNDVLVLLIQLTQGHANLQKIVAFESAFDKLADIVELEGYSDGGIVVEDCLRLMLNLLRNNPSNQTFFREGSYIQRVGAFFELDLDREELEVGWSSQKVNNTLLMLQVMRTLVSPSNPTQVTTSCQTTLMQCGLLDKLCETLMADGIPADILTETINVISEAIRGHTANQTFFASVKAPSEPPRSALVLLLMSMVNEKQPFALRCAVLYAFQCFLHQSPGAQTEVMKPLLMAAPTAKDDDGHNDKAIGGEVTVAELLCGGLFSRDRLSNWFCSVALAHCLVDREDDIKKGLLGLRLAATSIASDTPVSMMQQLVTILVQCSKIQTRFGIMMLFSSWLSRCPSAVSAFLSTDTIIPYLTGQIGSNEHDETERLCQGVCAFLLGLCVIHGGSGSGDNDEGSSDVDLLQLIEKRIGVETFLDKLGEVSKHEAYNKTLKHPQLRCQAASDLLFDYKFCQQFKIQEHDVICRLSNSSAGSKEDGEEASTSVLARYKDLIRDQDERINDISRANIYLQRELAEARQQLEEASVNLQMLTDQNSLLKAQQNNGVTPPPAAAEESDKVIRLERELEARDVVIQELEMRLATSQKNETANSSEVDDLQFVENNNIRKQLEALRVAVTMKDQELEAFRLTNQSEIPVTIKYAELKSAYDALQGEQDDLLLMLNEQDFKIADYKKRLKSLGQNILDDDDDEEDEYLQEENDCNGQT